MCYQCQAGRRGRLVVACLGTTGGSRGRCDAAEELQSLVDFIAGDKVVQADDTILVVTVLPFSATRISDDDYGVDPEAVREEREECLHEASRALSRATQRISQAKKGLKAQGFAIWPKGGASAVGAAISSFVEEHCADLVLAGRRHQGAFKRSIMALAGLGSVSEYLVNHLNCPLVVVKPRQAALAGAAVASSICLAVSDSSETDQMLQWVSRELIGPDDEVHLITVSHCYWPIFELDIPSTDPREIIAHCRVVLEDNGVSFERVRAHILQSSGPPSSVPGCISHFINNGDFTMAVTGNRCLKGLNRFVTSALTGSKSVSLECMHQVQRPILIYRHA